MTRDENFSLSSVLKYRKSIEEEIAREVAFLAKRLEQEEIFLVEMELKKKRIVAEHRERRRPTVEELEIFHSYMPSLESSISCQKKRVSEMIRDLEKKREELVLAAMNKKIMETIRDREWDEYRRLNGISEQRTLDEIAVNGYCRNM